MKTSASLISRQKALAFMLMLACFLTTKAALKNNTEYYIWLNIYEKLLGSNEAGTGPAISAYGKNTDADSYIFVAESSGKSGYVLLRQKSSGKYLAASSANAWSVVFESRSTDDRFCWQVDEGTYTYLVNKKSGNYLGVDGANKGSNYVSVYYDKPKGSHSQFSAIPVVGSSWDEARQAYESAVYTNAQGVREVDYCQLNNKTIDRSDAIDIHITSNDNPILGTTTVNLGSEQTWLIFDNIVPSTVISSYLKYVNINGAKAANGTNCRVAIYLNGAAVIPLPESAMTCSGTNGDFTLAVGNHKDLEEQSNTMTNFVLRRGYMATLATGTGGTGYSRVFVADHADLTVTLPNALTKRVTSVNVKNWQYLSKKGWGNTSGSSGADHLRATWYWSWSAGYNSTNNFEYVPCRQHRYWPSASEVNNRTASASLSLNEPEHSEQHTSDKCSCGGTISEWDAYKIGPDFLPGGGRIGSPQPTAFSYLTNFCNYVDNNASRCDFTVTHAYWDMGSYSESGYADYFVNQCKTIWNNTGRPVWLTEMEISASWNSNKVSSYDQNRKYLQVLLQKMEECPWIERYAIYGTDMWQTYMFYDANPSHGLTPAGQVYRDHRATFAYNANYTKVPTWWAPSVKTPSLSYEISTADSTFTFVVSNTNGDATDRLVFQRKSGNNWVDAYTATDRSTFEGSTIRYAVPLREIDRENDTFRVVSYTLYGGTAISAEESLNYIVNSTIVTTSKEEVPGWTCERNAANGYTKEESGDTYLEVWSPTAKLMDFNYYQDIQAIPNGVYRLSAVCFNSSNGEEGATVNGHVGLYAIADGVNYFTPITKDSEIDYKSLTIVDTIIVRNGTMRIGIRNVGQMTARWAGADNFELFYLGTEEEVLKSDYKTMTNAAEASFIGLFPTLAEDVKDASGLIANADCSRGTTARWTVSNMGVNSSQAFDGDNNNQYFDKWNAGSLSSSMQQTLTYLPQGTYQVSALLRGTTDITITLKAEHTAADGTKKTYSTSIKGKGDQTITGSDYQRGWELATLEPIQVRRGEQLTIIAETNVSSTAWWSADHFQLIYSPLPEEDEDDDENAPIPEIAMRMWQHNANYTDIAYRAER